MTRKDHMVKWSVYGLALLLVWLIDIAVLSRYPLWGVHPILLPLAVAAVAALESPFSGGAFGLVTGLLWCTTYAGVSAVQIFLLTATGLLVGIAAQYALSRAFPGFFICAIGALAIQEGYRLLAHLLMQSPNMSSYLQVAGLEFGWTLVWSAPVYLLFYLVYRRVGGTKLA